MEIKKVNKIELSEISNSVFLSEKWLDIYDKVQCVGIFDNNNKIIGGFYYFIQKKIIFSYYRNAPYSPSINLTFKVNSKNKSKLLTEKKKILTLVSNFFKGKKALLLYCVLPSNINDTQPFTWNKFKIGVKYTYMIDLTETEENIRNNFSPERRNDIKKAIKDDVTLKLETNYNTVKKIVNNTFNRKNKNIDNSMLDQILFNFANSNNSFAFVAYKAGIPIATSFCINDNNTCYYLLGGYDDKNKHAGAGALCVDGAIRHSKKLGLKIFDFEGSRLPEVEKYFRGFGGEMIPMYSFQRGGFVMEIVMKFIKRELF